MNGPSVRSRRPSSTNQQMSPVSTRNLSTRSPPPYGRQRTSRRVYCASSLEGAIRSSRRLVRVASGRRSMYYWWGIPRPPSPRSSSTSMGCRRGASILLGRVVQLSVSLSTSPETQRHMKQCWSQGHWYSVIQVFAASMSLIRWMIMLRPFFMRLWNSKLSQLLRQALYPNSTLGLLFSQLPTPLSLAMTLRNQQSITSTYPLPSSPDSTSST